MVLPLFLQPYSGRKHTSDEGSQGLRKARNLKMADFRGDLPQPQRTREVSHPIRGQGQGEGQDSTG